MLRTICLRSSFLVLITLMLLATVAFPDQEESDKQSAEEPGQLVLSPAAETGPELYTSWPMIVSVSLWRKISTPDAQGKLPMVAPITIRAKQGSWREALVVEVKNVSGSIVAWPLHPVQRPEANLTIGVDDTAAA
ncbi:MAG: hypothetical protein PHI97_32530, partial [Desulfobulbus sp.]|nr:hypothetical protein [Desulfobulbus sp.]